MRKKKLLTLLTQLRISNSSEQSNVRDKIQQSLIKLLTFNLMLVIIANTTGEDFSFLVCMPGGLSHLQLGSQWIEEELLECTPGRLQDGRHDFK